MRKERGGKLVDRLGQEHVAPGITTIRKKAGAEKLCWRASHRARGAGYASPLVRLHGNPDEPADAAAMAATCKRLEAQMLEWLGGRVNLNPHPPGTIAWLCHQFQTDQESPYHGLRQATREFYDDYIKILIRTVGRRRIDAVNGRDINRWHREWGDPAFEGGPRRYRRALGGIQTLRRVVSDGVATRVAGCKELSDILGELEFEGVKKRTLAPTHEHLKRFREAAAELSAKYPESAIVAVATTLQFEFAIRQKDIIGEWVGKGEENPKAGGLVLNGRRWQWGLQWAHIRDWQLEKPTSKSNGNETARHDITSSPDAFAALQTIPPEQRVGPVILDPRTRLPFAYNTFWRAFKRIADAAGWPAGMWSTDNRAGAITEAREAETSRDDRMEFATHLQESTARGYERPGAEPSRRVVKARLAKRGQA